MMFMTKPLCLFLLVVSVLFNVSCSSLIYPQKTKYRNNTVTFVTNLNNVNVKFSKAGENYEELLGSTKPYSGNKNQLIYTFDKLRYKQLRLELFGENLESQFVKIKRVPRGGAIVQDILLSPITFGLPIIIDPFRGDFYKISKKSKLIEVEMRYTQEFMLREYKKIEKSTDPKDFSDYITYYPYSNSVYLATNRKDSLELNSALSKADEKAIDEFIRNHDKSKFLPQAEAVKKEMTTTRYAFDDAQKIDKAYAFEAFIQKYPNSLQLKSARIKMMTVAERDCINAAKLDSTINYLENYLNKYRNIIEEVDFKTKSRRLEELLAKQIVLELDQNEADKYKAYKSLWNKYISLTSQYNYISLNELDSYKEKISHFLFNKLAETKDEKSQVDFLSKVKNDYESFFQSYGWGEGLPISYMIVNDARSRNGLLKLYNQNYFKSYYERLGEAPAEMADLYSYKYKESVYKVLDNVDYEEILFENDLYSSIKLYSKGKKVLENSAKLNKTDYFQNGQLVKTQYYQYDNNGNNQGYAYEFEKGVNLTLKALAQKLDDADKLLAQKNYQEAVNAYEECKNNYPYDIAENIRLSNSLSKANNLLDEYNRKQEEIREAEERKKEQARLAEEKRLGQIRLAEERKREQERALAQKNNRNHQNSNEDNQPKISLSKLVGTYKDGDGFARLNINGTGRAYNTTRFVVPEGNFTWKAEINNQGKNILVLNYDDGYSTWCYFKERKYSENIIKTVLYQNYDENDNPVGLILIKQ